MKDNKYAPVIIPTLNRFEHFKRCLESLEHCTGAEYTDVYVALDYPPSECYRVGWEMINSYLTEKESEHGFSHLFVIRRSSNYGICKQDGNYELILKDLSKISDRYISYPLHLQCIRFRDLSRPLSFSHPQTPKEW